MPAFCIGGTCGDIDKLPTDQELRALTEEEARRVATEALRRTITGSRATPTPRPRPTLYPTTFLG